MNRQPGIPGLQAGEDVNSDYYGAQAGELADLGAEAGTEQPEGEWYRIAFKGFVELTGFVTEVTVAGQPVFHVDLPEKIWGGNPMAWQEYAATGLHSRRPVTEESVRAAWESERARRTAIEERQRQYELEAGDPDDTEDEDDDEEGGMS